MPTYQDDPSDPHFRFPQFGERPASCREEAADEIPVHEHAEFFELPTDRLTDAERRAREIQPYGDGN